MCTISIYICVQYPMENFNLKLYYLFNLDTHCYDTEVCCETHHYLDFFNSQLSNL